jgi:signal recognition particle receptor subunit beta
MVLWDIAGAENNFSIPMHYVKGAAGFLLVIDGTRNSSLETAVELIASIKQEVGDIPYVIAVNKNDLPWEVNSADLQLSLPGEKWFSTSARTGENVENAFLALGEKVR